jgi:endonuclease-3
MKRKRIAQPDFEAITAILRDRLGDPENLHKASPLSCCDSALEVLLATILTQATNDRNAMKAWLNFKARYAEPHQALASSAAELAEVIRPAGLTRQKTASFQKTLTSLPPGGGFCAARQADADKVWEALLALPGVGPKTAACAMLFGLGLPAFPVDLHINRIAWRMGWVAPHSPPERTQTELTRMVPPGLYKELHILLLELGRKYCRPRGPRCLECPLHAWCPYPMHQ